jgi:hypothetical protein
MLPADEADDLTLYSGLCALAVAFRDGLPRLPEVPAPSRRIMERRGPGHRALMALTPTE